MWRFICTPGDTDSWQKSFNISLCLPLLLLLVFFDLCFLLFPWWVLLCPNNLPAQGWELPAVSSDKDLCAWLGNELSLRMWWSTWAGHIPSSDKDLVVSGGVRAPQLGGKPPLSSAPLHISPGEHEAPDQHGLNETCLLHGATEEEGALIRPWYTCQVNSKLCSTSCWAAQSGHQRLDNNHLLLFWKQIKLWALSR